MKKIYRFVALICVSAAVAISCVEENLNPEPMIPAVNGDDIIFGVRAGFEDSAPATKTDYSGEDYTHQGKTYERIDWVVNDKIEIYSPEAENPYATLENQKKSTHYVVTNLKSNDENAGSTGKGSDYAQLANVGDAGLRWNGNKVHNFYAMYPSSEMFRTETGSIPDNIQKGVYMGLDEETGSKVMVYGVIDDVQQPTVVEDGEGSGNYIAKPNMNYAYMVAKTSVDPTQNNSVKLSFVPIVTAVEIELYNAGNESVSIKEIEVSSNQQIAGGFTVNLTDDWVDGYPKCTNIEGNLNEEIQISPRLGESFSNVPIASGKYLKFTVFLLPESDITNLTISLSSDGMGYTDKTLTNANIPAKLKTRIKKLYLPGSEDFQNGGNNWMDQLNPEAQIRYLSLPGTGGSFTKYASDSFKEQNLTFEEQWTLGVRAFELCSDRPSSGSTSLGGENVTCNKADVRDSDVNNSSYWTVIKAVRAILSRLNTYPSETAALILTYQPEDNTPNRNVSEYARSLSAMLSGSGTTGQGNILSKEEVAKIIPFRKDLTLENSRGKLILICRPNQRDEHDYGTYSANSFDANLVTSINGCGTAKDRWGARGYKVILEKTGEWTQGTVRTLWFYDWGEKSYTSNLSESMTKSALDISNEGDANFDIIESTTNTSNGGITGSLTANDYRTGYDVAGANYVEYYMANSPANIFASSNTYMVGNVGVTRPDITKVDQLNFAYETNQLNTYCWFQEWARVIPEDTHATGRWDDGNSNGNYDIYWFESLEEKLANVKHTFDIAINDEKENHIYINSLCGYLATSDTDKSPTWSLAPSMPVGASSIWGGAGGDIKALSDRLNPAFYNYISEKGLGVNNNITGPTGIVLMDYVMRNPTLTEDPSDDSEIYNYTEDLISAIVANNKKYTPDNILTGGGNNAGSGNGSGSGSNSGSGDGTGSGGAGINFFE